MKVGDKVVCVSLAEWDPLTNISGGLPFVGRVLTIRETFVTCRNRLGLRFHEIKQIKNGLGVEHGFAYVYFRKIDTRPELSELTDEMILTAPTTKELQTA